MLQAILLFSRMALSSAQVGNFDKLDSLMHP